MSAEARPISASQFAEAVQDLPVENLYSKAYEINNSIAHLRQSNKLLQEYSDSIRDDASLNPTTRSEGDKDCLDAIKENELVIERQSERVQLLKAEVERRGGRWHEAEPEGKDNHANGNEGPATNDEGVTTTTTAATNNPGRLTDDELRHQLEARMNEDNGDEGGMHL